MIIDLFYMLYIISSRMIFDVSNINKIFDMMYEKYSKMNKVQIEKRKQKLKNDYEKRFSGKDRQNYISQSKFIEFCIKSNKNYLKLKIDNVPIYFPSNTKKKDVCFKEYTKEKELGSGFFGKTYLASKLDAKYAIKVQNISSNQEIKMVKNEAKLAKKGSDLGISPKIYDSFFCLNKGAKDTLKFFIIQEYMNEGDLKSWLKKGNTISPKMKKKLIKKIEIMHQNQIVHNDLHTGNIFVKQQQNGEMELFIGDFGISYDIKDEKSENDRSFEREKRNLRANVFNEKVDWSEMLFEPVNIEDIIIKDMILNQIKYKF
jgi:tRNA A-37 threonylcarbamoyl transferase component Bud32